MLRLHLEFEKEDFESNVEFPGIWLENLRIWT